MASGALTTTTTTQQWILKKYSRSRPVPEPLPKRQKLGEMKAQPRPKEEFDHFTQPQLLLRLETTRSSSAFASDLPITHSMLLNIYYDPHYHSPSQRRSGDQILTLDSFDLMSFSSPTIRTRCPPDELPLKGVFKDEIVGFRYIYVDPSKTTGSEFKRLQFKFESREERERFMASVQGIIPFKPAESTTRIASSSTTVPRSSKGKMSGSQRGGSSSNFGQRGSTPSALSMAPPPPPPRVHRPSPTDLGTHRPLPVPSPFLSQQQRQPLHSPSPSPSLKHLSARLSTLLPNLTLNANQEGQAAQGEQGGEAAQETGTASEQLVVMGSEEFEKLFEQVLFEDGFEELVERVQEMVQKEMSS